MTEKETYDVIIAGAGLAGLTLAFQLTQNNPEIQILILEKREELAPVATHKVGESTSEIGAFYLRNVLGLGEYLDHSHLRKFGFRFFFSPENKSDISKRVEVGSRIEIPHPAYQIDRGIFENEVLEKIDPEKVHVLKGATIKSVELNASGHKVHVDIQDQVYVFEGRWFVDSTGRRGLLRRQLNLDRPVDHTINAAWFRIGEAIDIDDWSDDLSWKMHYGFGKRRFSTNHLMGEGYWFWIIPLVSNSTSFGIVADPRYHPFESFNTFEKALDWLKIHEPHAARVIEGHKEKVLDFKVMKDFAFDTKQFYSTDRWALTGEAAAFLDPFYSPGSDFIALNNSWITDLITHDLKGENNAMRTKIYELAHRELFNGWLTLYQDKYKLFSNTQVMLAKITWDWATYWGIPALMFMNGGYTNLDVLRKYSSSDRSLGYRFSQLNKRMQQFFLDWDELGIETCDYDRVNTFSLKILYDFHMGLYEQHDPEHLITKITNNLERLEDLYRAIFWKVQRHVKEEFNDETRIDPYTMDLKDSLSTLDAKSHAEEAKIPSESAKNDIELIWLLSKEAKNIKVSNRIAENIERVEQKFMHSMHHADAEMNVSTLVATLEKDTSIYRSIGFEGASFALGSKDIKSTNSFDYWRNFRDLADNGHHHHIDIGLGWSFAKEGTYPSSNDFDPITTALLYDGMGYYYALFKVRKTIIDQSYPTGLSSRFFYAFDRGIGRRMWYMCKGNTVELQKMINSFTPIRQKDLWFGIGVAASYVGGMTTDSIQQLLQIADINVESFKNGVGFSFLSRKRPIDRTEEMHLISSILFNTDPDTIINRREKDIGILTQGFTEKQIKSVE